MKTRLDEFVKLVLIAIEHVDVHVASNAIDTTVRT